jgi:transcriptional regulator with XRE-family HTH domain
MNITVSQLKRARELLQWSIRDLAVRSRVPQAALVDFEEENRNLTEGAIIHVRWALERAGMEFVGDEDGGAGVRFRKASGKVILPRGCA